MENKNQKDEVMKEVIETNKCGEYIGCTKWFSDSLGFGFVTICDGELKGKDIFVHHSGIKPLNSNYKTLKKGEYINFNIIEGEKGLQAVDVTGICGGPLMCDAVINSSKQYTFKKKVNNRGGKGGMEVDGGYKIKEEA